MKSTEHFVKRVSHLRRFATFIRILTTISFVISGLGIFILVFIQGMLATVFTASVGVPMESEGAVLGVLVASFVFGFLTIIPHLLFYFLAEMLISQADMIDLQMMAVKNRARPAKPIIRNEEPEPRERYVWE